MTQIDAPENHPCIRGSGAQTQLHPFAAVQANTDGTCKSLQGSLFEHGVILMNPPSVRLFAQEGWDFVVVHAA
jgi:hypothetical protein